MSVSRRMVLAATIFGLTLSLAGPASAAKINVSTSAQLVSAFMTADSNPNNTYDVVLAKATYKPASTLSLKKGHVNLIGSSSGSSPTQYVIDGQSKQIVIAVTGSSSLDVKGVTIQNGSAGFTLSGGGLNITNGAWVNLTSCIVQNNRSSQPGGGISVGNATLQMTYVTVDGNSNSQYPACGGGGGGSGVTGGGGGLATYLGASVDVYQSTFTNNKACRGGGIQVAGDSSNFTMENSTLSGNEGEFRGGAVMFMGGNGYHTLRFNTISENKAGTTPSTNEKKYGGGIGFSGFSGFLSMAGNILAKNSVTFDMKSTLFYKGSDCYWESGFFTAQSESNIIGDLSNCSQLGRDTWWGIGWEGAPFDPVLGALTTNGAKTGYQLKTYKPLAGSPVIGNYQARSQPCEGDWDCPPFIDERQFRRPNAAAGKSDFGAIEFNGTP